MNIYSEEIRLNNGTINYNGQRCLVSLKIPILDKYLKEYRYILGNTIYGYLGGTYNNTHFIKIGKEKNNSNRLIIPMDNIASIQPCEKIIQDDRILIIED